MGSLADVLSYATTRGECDDLTDSSSCAMFLAESDLFFADPIGDWQQQQSIFDCKDWGSGNSLAAAATTAQEYQNHLYIDPCCEFGQDVFFNSTSAFQTTPISVLDYVHEQQQLPQHEFGNGFLEQDQGAGEDSMEIQELLAGFAPQNAHPHQQQEHHHHLPHHQHHHHEEVQLPPRPIRRQQLEAEEIDRLAGELAGEIDSSSKSPSISLAAISSASNSGYQQIPQQGTAMSPTNSRLSSSQGSCFNPRTPPPHPRTPQPSSSNLCATNLEPTAQEQVFATPKPEPVSQQQQIIPVKHEIFGHGGVVDYHQQLNFPKFEPVDQQLRLVRMLLSCAGAVAADNLDLARAVLVQLRALVVPHGSPMQRLASYVTEALVARLSRNTRSSMFQGLIVDQLQQLNSATRSDMLEAFWVFYEYIPIGKFTHLTMNQILLEAAERERAIHVVDFQVWYGAQWPSFIQSLAMRPGGPPIVRMTAIGSSLRDLQEAGSKLLDCARSLGVPFEYCILNVELERFHAGMVELRDGEAVLVNSLCQFHCFLKRNLEHFLEGLRSLRPRLVVMAENDADHNSPDFMHRFMACLHYYSAVFDAFDASLHMPGTLQGRKKLEELIAAQKLRNMIACEGSERVERHESMRAWNARMEGVGFRAVSMSHKAVNQASLLLKLYYSDGYTLVNQDGFLILGWRGMPLNGVGAWI